MHIKLKYFNIIDRCKYKLQVYETSQNNVDILKIKLYDFGTLVPIW